MESNKQLVKPRIIVFDVYETLLGMGEMERRINTLTDSVRGYTIWFEIFMQYCFVSNSLDNYYDFMSIAKASLQITGAKLGKKISDDDAANLLDLLKHLPVLEEVPSCLSELNDEGYIIIALTNAPEKIVCDRMERTGLVSYFQNVLSAEKVKKYKPEKKVYEWAAKKMDVATSEMLMVTSHAWDIAGAANAGMKTAFLKKDKGQLPALLPQPDLSCTQLSELVSILKNR